MTVPALRSSQGPTLSSSATTHAINMPATVSAGDMLVVLICANNSWGSGVLDGNWTAFQASNGVIYGGYKIAAGTEGGTSVAFTTTTYADLDYVVLSIYNHGSVAPQITAPTSGTSSYPDPAALTPSWGAADVMWVALAQNTIANFMVSPDGYASLSYQNGSTPKTAVAYKTATNTTTENPGAFTIGSARSWSAYTIGIKGYTPPTGNNALFFGGGF